MNGFPETPDRRRSSTSGDYQVLIVAEKFQTGYDQPLLHTMYVDKPLIGLARRADALAAQPDPPGEDRHVRPRLPQRRRRHPGGVQAVLRRDRRAPDRPEPALRHPPRPRRLRRAARRRGRERRRGCSPRSATSATTRKLYALLDPAVERFKALPERAAGRVPGRATALRPRLLVPLPDRLLRRHQARTRLPLLPRARDAAARLDARDGSTSAARSS